MSRRLVLAGGAALVSAGAAATEIDRALLRVAVTRAAALDQLHALVVARDGEVLVAESFRGEPLDRAVNVKSVSKTLVASLVGAAIDRRVLEGVEQRAAPLLGGLVPGEADPRVQAITVENLLTMQAGLERTSGPSYGRWVESRNWLRHALGRPFEAAPGERFLYSTGSYHILGALLAKAAGRDLHALARDWLGQPLGVVIPPWTRDPQGFFMGGNNMALSPLALLRFGEMWRMRGLWQGRRVLGEAWIDASWTARTRSPFSGDAYGYGWFLRPMAGQQAAYARGYGGQMLYVVPGRAATIVVISDPTRPARSEGHVGALHALVEEAILPALPSA